jgi:hypothetical protein
MEHTRCLKATKQGDCVTLCRKILCAFCASVLSDGEKREHAINVITDSLQRSIAAGHRSTACQKKRTFRDWSEGGKPFWVRNQTCLDREVRKPCPGCLRKLQQSGQIRSYALKLKISDEQAEERQREWEARQAAGDPYYSRFRFLRVTDSQGIEHVEFAAMDNYDLNQLTAQLEKCRAAGTIQTFATFTERKPEPMQYEAATKWVKNLTRKAKQMPSADQLPTAEAA